jgi:hypothetical protein
MLELYLCVSGGFDKWDRSADYIITWLWSIVCRGVMNLVLGVLGDIIIREGVSTDDTYNDRLILKDLIGSSPPS